MTLAAFLAACAAGALLSLLAEPFRRVSRIVAIAALAAALVAALALKPGTEAVAGEVRLVTGWYVGIFLSAGLAGALGLCLLGLVAGWPRHLAPAALATFGALGVALSAASPGVALIGAAAAATPALFVAIAGHTAATRAGDASARQPAPPTAARPEIEPALGAPADLAGIARNEIRTAALLVVAAALGAASVVGPRWAGEVGFPIAVAYLLLGLALAVRSGAVPFHAPAAHVSAAAGRLVLPLLLVWVPAGIAVVALAWSGATFQFEGTLLDLAAATIIVVGAATLVLGATGALLHGELEEILVYSIVQDAGFVLLALGARTPDVAGPARLWIIAFVVSKTALAAWVAAMAATFGTSRLDDLRGWVRRGPVLAAGLAAVVAATLGWPGSAVFTARSDVARLSLPGPLGWLGLLALLLALGYYARLFAVGLGEPSAAVERSLGDRLRWPATPQPAERAAAGDGGRSQVETAGALESAPAAAAPLPVTTTDERTPSTTEHTAPPPVPLRARLAAIAHAVAAGIRRGAAATLRAGARTAAASRSLQEAWRLNRLPAANALVLAVALVATAVAVGGFGSRDASASGIALEGAVSSAGVAQPTASAASAVPTGPLDEPSSQIEGPGAGATDPADESAAASLPETPPVSGGPSDSPSEHPSGAATASDASGSPAPSAGSASPAHSPTPKAAPTKTH